MDIIARERFAKFWRENLDTGCWEWTGSQHRQGYGHFYFSGKIVLAHRASWAMRHGHMPKPAQKVCHRCDNPCCVNPDHLFLGTQRDNARDCVAKGRARRSRPIGEKNGMTKFTADQVRDIHRDQRKHREIAADYGVSESTIGMIKRGYNWSHIHAEFHK